MQPKVELPESFVPHTRKLLQALKKGISAPIELKEVVGQLAFDLEKEKNEGDVTLPTFDPTSILFWHRLLEAFHQNDVVIVASKELLEELENFLLLMSGGATFHAFNSSISPEKGAEPETMQYFKQLLAERSVHNFAKLFAMQLIKTVPEILVHVYLKMQENKESLEIGHGELSKKEITSEYIASCSSKELNELITIYRAVIHHIEKSMLYSDVFLNVFFSLKNIPGVIDAFLLHESNKIAAKNTAKFVFNEEIIASLCDDPLVRLKEIMSWQNIKNKWILLRLSFKKLEEKKVILNLLQTQWDKKNALKLSDNLLDKMNVSLNQVEQEQSAPLIQSETKVETKPEEQKIDFISDKEESLSPIINTFKFNTPKTIFFKNRKESILSLDPKLSKLEAEHLAIEEQLGNIERLLNDMFHKVNDKIKPDDLKWKLLNYDDVKTKFSKYSSYVTCEPAKKGGKVKIGKNNIRVFHNSHGYQKGNQLDIQFVQHIIKDIIHDKTELTKSKIACEAEMLSCKQALEDKANTSCSKYKSKKCFKQDSFFVSSSYSEKIHKNIKVKKWHLSS